MTSLKASFAQEGAAVTRPVAAKPCASIDRWWGAVARHPRLGREDGTAIVTLLLLTAVVVALGVYATRGTQVELRIAHNDALGKQALYAAESGINHARSVIEGDGAKYNTYLTSGGTGGALSTIGAVVTLEDGLNYRFHAFGGQGTSDGYYVRAQDNYDEVKGANDPTKDVDYAVDVISRGRVGGAERIITSRVNNPPLCILGWPENFAGCPMGSVRGPTVFDENGSMKALRPVGFAPAGTASINLFYGDENALTLGATQVGGTACAVQPSPNPAACVNNPQIGCLNATDPAGRPIFPSLFLTDITDDQTSRAGDWQCGGTAVPPSSVCGVWKPFIPGGNAPNPKGGGALGTGADAYPPLPDATCSCVGSSHCKCDAESYIAEVRWDIASLTDQFGNPLVSGHLYRAQVMVHDGDQNQAGGDVGQGCVNFAMP